MKQEKLTATFKESKECESITYFSAWSRRRDAARTGPRIHSLLLPAVKSLRIPDCKAMAGIWSAQRSSSLEGEGAARIIAIGLAGAPGSATNFVRTVPSGESCLTDVAELRERGKVREAGPLASLRLHLKDDLKKVADLRVCPLKAKEFYGDCFGNP